MPWVEGKSGIETLQAFVDDGNPLRFGQWIGFVIGNCPVHNSEGIEGSDVLWRRFSQLHEQASSP